MIGSNLHRFKTNPKYVPLDFEAESLNLRFARPFQVSYAIADNKGFQTLKNEFILWDDINVSEEAAIITRFDKKTYLQIARPAKEVLEEFDQVIYDPSTEIVWQAGLGYDHYIHRNWRRLCGKKDDDSYLLRSIDVNALTKAVKKSWIPNISSPEAFLAWQYQASNYIEKGLKTNLQTVGKDLGIEHDYNTLHDALSDIDLMMKIFWKHLYSLDF